MSTKSSDSSNGNADNAGDKTPGNPSESNQPGDKDKNVSKPGTPVVLSDEESPATTSTTSGQQQNKSGRDSDSPSDDLSPEQILHSCPVCEEKNCLEDMVLHLTKHEDFFKDTSAPGRSKFSYLNGNYICSSCPFKTSHRLIFTEHVRHHVVLYPYSCRHCKLKVKGITALVKHHKEAHADKLTKLEIHTSKLLAEIMSKLGPQAPAADDILKLSKPQVRPRPIKPQEAPVGKPIVIDDDDESDKKEEPEPAPKEEESISLKIGSVMSIAGAPAPAAMGAVPPQPTPDASAVVPVSEFKPGRSQPVKLQGLVGCPEGKGDGKTDVEIFIKIPDDNGELRSTDINFGVRGQFYICLACHYETPSMVEFKSHMFAEIHSNLYGSLQKPCHTCGQQGVGHDRHVKPCPFVEELIKNIQKAKENLDKKKTDNETDDDTKSASEASKSDDKQSKDGKEKSSNAAEGPIDLSTESSSSGDSNSGKQASENGKGPETSSKQDQDDDSDSSETLPDLPTSDEQTPLPNTTDAIFTAESPKRGADSPSLESMMKNRKKRSAGRYSFNKGTYHCYSCPFQTNGTKAFRMHVWKHIHGKSMKCDHCPENIKYNYFQFCYLINGVMTLVHRMADWTEERAKKGLPVSILDQSPSSPVRASLGARKSDVSDSEAMEVTSDDEGSSGKKDAQDEPFDVESNCSRFYPWAQNRKKSENLEALLKKLEEQSEKSQAEMQELASKFVYKCGVPNCSFSHPEVECFSIHNLLKHQNLTPVPCSLCSKTFDGIDALIEHADGHREEKEIMRCMCLGCDYTCCQLQDLKKHHLMKHPNAQVLKCCFCYKEWNDLSRYMWHIQEHVIKEIKCPYCGITSADKNKIQQHMLETHEDLPRKIVVNTRIINRLEGPPASQEQVPSGSDADESVSSASERGKRTPSRERRERRSREQTPAASPQILADTPAEPEPEPEIPVFKCSKCSYSACTMGSVKKHENIHDTEQDKTQRFRCPSCPHSFDNYHRLINHVQFHAGTSIIRFYHCSHCGYCTDDMVKVEDHVLGKHPDLPFKFEVSQEKVLFQEKMANCPDCKYPFLWPKDFMRHIPTHSRLKPFIATLKSKLQGVTDANAAKEVIREEFTGYKASPRKGGYGTSRKRTADGSIIPVIEPEDDHDNGSVVSEESENSANGMNMAIDKHHCEYCEFSTNHFTILQSHMSTKHPEHAAKFKEPAVAPRVAAAAKGRATPSPVRPSPASTPESASSSRSSEREITNRYLKGNFKCPHCPYKAKNMKYLYRHLQQHKKVVQEGWKCAYCDYRTEVRKSGTMHVRRYHPDKPENLLEITGGMTEEEAAVAQGDTQAVPSLPESLEKVDLEAFQLKLPSEMVFKSPIKCPVCPFKNKVKYNLIQHLKAHTEEDKDEEPMDTTGETSEDDGAMGGSDSPIDTDPGDDETGVKSRAPKDHTEYCHKIQHMDLYQCNECVFMHRYPSKVLRHYHYRHAKLNPYKCGYCKFDSVESGKVIRHIHTQHAGMAIKVIKRTMARKADEGDDTSDEPDGVVMSRERDDIEQEGEGMQVIRDQLAQYIEKKDGNIQRCKFCNYEQHGASAIKRHVLSVHMKIYPWACKYCKMSSVEINKVKQHIAMSHPDQPVKVIQRNLTSIIGEEAQVEEPEDVKPDIEELNAAMGFPGPLPMDIKPEPDDDYGDGGGSGATGGRGASQGRPLGGVTGGRAPGQVTNLSGSVTGKSPQGGGKKSVTKMYHCAYCSYATKWNIRDVRTHIFHVHQMRKNFMCKYCKVGAKTKAQVLSHCAKFHPNMPMRARDMRSALTNIMPVQEQEEIVTVAVVDKNGLPILDVWKIRDQEFMAAQANPAKPPEDRPMNLTNRPDPIPVVPKPPDVTAQSLGQIMESTAEPMKANVTGKPLNVMWKCKICGLSKKILAQLKYHQVCHHLKLKPYSCPHCNLYFWKKTPVVQHIETEHPGMDTRVVSTMDDKIEYFKVNILKIIPSAEKKSRMVSNFSLESSPMDDNGDMEIPEDDEDEDNDDGDEPVGDDSANSVQDSSHLNLYRCRYCSLLMTSVDAIKGHLSDHHPEDPPEFEAVRKGPVLNLVTPVPRKGESIGSVKAIQILPEPPLVRRIKQEPDQAAPPPSVLNVPKLPTLKIGKIVKASTQLGLQKKGGKEPTGGILYKCKKCPMATEGQTIIRHHVMVHLGYKPYSCPYCDAFRAVKSYPVKLHIQKTHAGNEISVTHNQDPAMEERIHEIYEKFLPPRAQKMALQNAEAESTKLKMIPDQNLPKLGPIKIRLPIKFAKRPVVDQPQAPVETTEDESAMDSEATSDSGICSLKADTPIRRTVYKCMFGTCTYSTTQRPDVRRHLMREMKYKPYCCAYCDFREVNSGGLNKHFQRHPYKPPKIILRKNRAKEQKVEELIKQSAHVTFLKKVKGCDESASPKVPKYNLPKVIRIRPPPVPSPRPISPHKTLRSPLSPAFSSSSGSLAGSPVAKLTDRPRQLLNQRASPGGAFSCPYDFCNFATYMKAKLSDHVMRHGPHKLKCSHCSAKGYYPSELRKHHRSKHAADGLPFKYHNILPDTEGYEGIPCPPDLGKSATQRTTPKSAPAKPLPARKQEVKSPVVGTTVKMTKATPENPMPVLDGLCLNIDLTPDRHGYYRCDKCDYRSKQRELFKKHVLIHEPPRLRCKFCKTKYRVMERLRRHSRIAHPFAEPAYEIIEPGDPDYEGVKIKVEKSDEGYDAGEDYSPPQQKKVKLTIRSDGGQYRVKNVSSPGPDTKSADPFNVQFCCHKCSYKAKSLMDFTTHLHTQHKMGDFADDDDNDSERSSESSDDKDDAPLGNINKPFQCNYCAFSANQRFSIKQHCVRQHPGQPVLLMERTTRGYQIYNRGYRSDSSSDDEVIEPHMETYVKLIDILQIPKNDLEELLSCNGLTGIRL